MKTLIQQFNDIQKIRFFEIEVKNLITEENEFLTFEIYIDDKNLYCHSEPMTEAEEKSDKIKIILVELDDHFDIDAHLQDLYSNCIEEIINSDFYELID